MFEFTHVGIVVSNTDRSLAFYCNILDCTLMSSYQDERIKLTCLSSGSRTIELIEYATPENRTNPGTFDHLAFTVNDIDQAILRLKKAGVTFLFDVPRIVNQKKLCFFLGPDGERLELIQEIQ